MQGTFKRCCYEKRNEIYTKLKFYHTMKPMKWNGILVRGAGVKQPVIQQKQIGTPEDLIKYLIANGVTNNNFRFAFWVSVSSKYATSLHFYDNSEAYSEPSQISKMELFVKVLAITSNDWLVCEYAFATAEFTIFKILHRKLILLVQQKFWLDHHYFRLLRKFSKQDKIMKIAKGRSSLQAAIQLKLYYSSPQLFLREFYHIY